MLVFTAAMLALKGCAISTAWPSLAPVGAERSDDLVVLVLTHVVVNPGQRSEFDRQNSRVMASMASHPGLIGHAARRGIKIVVLKTTRQMVRRRGCGFCSGLVCSGRNAAEHQASQHGRSGHEFAKR